jgi:hypothetical protein
MAIVKQSNKAPIPCPCQLNELIPANRPIKDEEWEDLRKEGIEHTKLVNDMIKKDLAREAEAEAKAENKSS